VLDDFTLNRLPVLDTGLGFFSLLAAFQSLTPFQARGDEVSSVKCHHVLGEETLLTSEYQMS
jgi:hypothetical protein